MNKYKEYLQEIMSKDKNKGTREFFDAFDELLENGIIGTIADYRYVSCFYTWNKENIKRNASKEEFIIEFEKGVNSI